MLEVAAPGQKNACGSENTSGGCTTRTTSKIGGRSVITHPSPSEFGMTIVVPSPEAAWLAGPANPGEGSARDRREGLGL